MSNIPRNHLIPFVFIFIGTYVASYLFFILPLTMFSGVLVIVSIVVAIPALYSFYRWTGWKNTLIIFLILSGFVLFIEGFGIITGIPYGQFYYSSLTGFKLFGLVPWTLPFAFIPLLFGIMAVVTQYVQRPWKIILLSGFLLVVVDLVLDPIFVHLGVWIWITPGIYYGVPLSNYIGWFFTGLISAAILLVLLRWRIGPSCQFPIFVAISLILILGFWSGYTLWIGLVIPFVVSLFLLVFIIWSFIKFWPIK